MNPTNNKLDIFPVKPPRPNKFKAGVEWVRAKAKAARAAWLDFIEKSARAGAEKKASYAVFAKDAWGKAKADRAEAAKTAADQAGQPRWSELCSVAKEKADAEAKSEIAYREARSNASCAQVKATRIFWKIAQARYKADESETKTPAAIDAAKTAWETAAKQAARDKDAAEAVKALNKATAAHTEAKEKEKEADERRHRIARLLAEAEATGFKAEVRAAKAEVETVTAKNALDWAREEVVAAKIAAKAAGDTDSRYKAETGIAKAEAHAEVAMVAFARAKEKSAAARAGVKAAHDEARQAGVMPEVETVRTDFIKTVWDHAEAEVACAAARAEVALAEIVWARTNAASAHAVAGSEHGGANPAI
ncbi:MAG: hypothetical protein WC701_09930 [Kiritimatiellales bacterium]|jgi:hypothetical protein